MGWLESIEKHLHISPQAVQKIEGFFSSDGVQKAINIARDVGDVVGTVVAPENGATEVDFMARHGGQMVGLIGKFKDKLSHWKWLQRTVLGKVESIKNAATSVEHKVEQLRDLAGQVASNRNISAIAHLLPTGVQDGLAAIQRVPEGADTSDGPLAEIVAGLEGLFRSVFG